MTCEDGQKPKLTLKQIEKYTATRHIYTKIDDKDGTDVYAVSVRRNEEGKVVRVENWTFIQERKNKPKFPFD